jgi:hypothetical protein
LEGLEGSKGLCGFAAGWGAADSGILKVNLDTVWLVRNSGEIAHHIAGGRLDWDSPDLGAGFDGWGSSD